MARYKIWDKKTNIFALSGEMFTPAQWIDRYKYLQLEEAVPVVAGGLLNGAFMNELSNMKESFIRMGCDFSTCNTQEEILAKMEAFEDTAVAGVSAEERIAAAIELQTLLAMPDEEEEIV